MLVRESQIVPSSQAGLPEERHPRTGVGLTRDGAALLVTIDGRRATAVGMTLREFAGFMQSLDAIWAVNLDGGASTTMVVRGKVRNAPSDPYGERRVPNAVVLLSFGRPGIVHLVSQLREWDSRISPAGGGPGGRAGHFDGFRGEV
jgi:exopolysaccharide biosynthesis protein